MTEISHEKAQRLALQAQRKILLRDYPAAIENQRRAVGILEAELHRLEADPSASADERKECAHRLADYWGRLGGIYRRADRVPEGIAAYEHGKEIERRYQLDESYNRTNWIVLELLEDPARLDELAPDIDEVIDLIQAQVRGPRRDEWWAWADLGLARLLGGRVREAQEAYEQFQETGARPDDYRSVLLVLRSLHAAFALSKPDLAVGIEGTIRALEA